MPTREVVMTDTILCADKDDAIRVIDSVGSEHIDDWEYLENGNIRIYLNCKMEDL